MKICANKNCEQAGKPQPIENFHRHPKAGDGRVAKCKKCSGEIQKAYAKKKKETYETFYKTFM